MREDFDLFLKENNIDEEYINNWMELVDKNHLIGINSDVYEKSKSGTHGFGLFALKDINAGEYIGIVEIDNKRTTLARYANHSGIPNIEFVNFDDKSSPDIRAISHALVDIQKGKELLVNYRHKKLNQ